MSPVQAVTVQPIGDDDIYRVATFLHSHLNGRVTTEKWAAGIATPWLPQPPNRGYMLLDGPEIVGVNLAFYSTREIDGGTQRFCNLGALCVLEPWRGHTLRLVRKLLSQKGYTFTDFSPSGAVVEINQRLGFASIDTTTCVNFNLPWPASRRATVTSSGSIIRSTLGRADLQLYEDHSASPAVSHILLRRAGDYCYVITRRDRRKGLPIFASLLYVSNSSLFKHHARHMFSAILLRTGALATLVEKRLVDDTWLTSIKLTSARPKMVRSLSVAPDEVDYLYSELTQISW